MDEKMSMRDTAEYVIESIDKNPENVGIYDAGVNHAAEQVCRAYLDLTAPPTSTSVTDEWLKSDGWVMFREHPTLGPVSFTKKSASGKRELEYYPDDPLENLIYEDGEGTRVYVPNAFTTERLTKFVDLLLGPDDCY